MTTMQNAEVLRTVAVNPAIVEGFNMAIKAKSGFTLKTWPKAAGERPTDAMLTAAVMFSTQRKCGAESLFLALQMRPNGASLSELACIINAGPAHNHTRDCERAGYLVRSKGSGRFMVTFTLKGAKALEKALSTASVEPVEPTKAADKPKAKKAGKVAGEKTLTSKAKGGNKSRAKPKPDAVSAEMLAVVNAELIERGDAPIEPTDVQMGEPEKIHLLPDQPAQ